MSYPYRHTEPSEMEESIKDAETSSEVYLFSDASIRKGFQRKVFSLVLLQFLVSFGGIAIFTYVTPLKEFVQNNSQTLNFIGGAFVIIDVVAIIVLSTEGRKWRTWIQYVILGMITVFSTLGVGILTSQVGEILAVSYTLGMVVSVAIVTTGFLLLVKQELSWWMFYLLATISVAISGVILYFTLPTDNLGVTKDNSILYVVIAGVVTLLFSILWFCLLQGMMAPKGCLSSSPEEFVRGALFLYLGGIMLFLIALGCVLMIMGSGVGGGGGSGGGGGGGMITPCFCYYPWIGWGSGTGGSSSPTTAAGRKNSSEIDSEKL